MSKIVEETDSYITLFRYIHDEPDSYASWELDENGHEKYSAVVHEAEHFAFFETKVTYRINKITGEVTYLNYE